MGGGSWVRLSPDKGSHLVTAGAGKAKSVGRVGDGNKRIQDAVSSGTKSGERCDRFEPVLDSGNLSIKAEATDKPQKTNLSRRGDKSSLSTEEKLKLEKPRPASGTTSAPVSMAVLDDAASSNADVDPLARLECGESGGKSVSVGLSVSSSETSNSVMPSGIDESLSKRGGESSSVTWGELPRLVESNRRKKSWVAGAVRAARSLEQAFLGFLGIDPLAGFKKELDKINALETEARQLSKGITPEQFKTDPKLRQEVTKAFRLKTAEFKQRLEQGETLEDIRPEAYAIAREAARLVTGMRPYDVQVLGALAMDSGYVAEMKTGEGKTLTEVLPVYLNALAGKGVHVVTVNETLAKRDKEWMGPVYEMLGLSTGLVLESMSPEEKRKGYGADVTYITNQTLGFDYLRDRKAVDPAQKVQRPPFFALVDEVDEVLIDEARTPLIISERSKPAADEYRVFADVVASLKPGIHYKVDRKTHSAWLTENGQNWVENELTIIDAGEHLKRLDASARWAQKVLALSAEGGSGFLEQATRTIKERMLFCNRLWGDDVGKEQAYKALLESWARSRMSNKKVALEQLEDVAKGFEEPVNVPPADIYAAYVDLMEARETQAIAASLKENKTEVLATANRVLGDYKTEYKKYEHILHQATKMREYLSAEDEAKSALDAYTAREPGLWSRIRDSLTGHTDEGKPQFVQSVERELERKLEKARKAREEFGRTFEHYSLYPHILAEDTGELLAGFGIDDPEQQVLMAQVLDRWQSKPPEDPEEGYQELIRALGKEEDLSPGLRESVWKTASGLWEAYHRQSRIPYLQKALEAQALFRKGKDYTVEDGEVKIIDEFKGRISEGRRYNNGLHQALEAKEGLAIKPEQRPTASITYPNLFRRYPRLAGMSGTAKTSEEEFLKLYGLKVVQIPTNKPVARVDEPDVVFRTAEEKFQAVVDEVRRCFLEGQPVLVGTRSVEVNRYLSALLWKAGIPNQALNAESVKGNTEEENRILAGAGRSGMVTVATNMAGRGVDIKPDLVNFKKLAITVAQATYDGKPVVVDLDDRKQAEELASWLTMSNRQTSQQIGELYGLAEGEIPVDQRGLPDKELSGFQDPGKQARLVELKKQLIPYRIVEDDAIKPPRAGEVVIRVAPRGWDESEGVLHLKGEDYPTGGLMVIGTERHFSRRIDDQLIGRSGRQGDPGRSRFFLSLDDELLRVYGGSALRRVFDALGVKAGEGISDKKLDKFIAKAQKAVENVNYSMRENTTKYDQVLNKHRELFYDLREQVVAAADSKSGFDLPATIVDWAAQTVVRKLTADYLPPSGSYKAEDVNAALREVCKDLELPPVQLTHHGKISSKRLEELISGRLSELYTKAHEALGQVNAGSVPSPRTDPKARLNLFIRKNVLMTMDHAWTDHLEEMDNLKDALMRGMQVVYAGEEGENSPVYYSQSMEPIDKYRAQAFYVFRSLIYKVQEEVTRRVLGGILREAQAEGRGLNPPAAPRSEVA